MRPGTRQTAPYAGWVYTPRFNAMHDESELRALDVHERGREHPWAVSDAPAEYVEEHLTGIVGLEVTVTGVEGKAKLSQNRSEADRRGVVAGLAGEPFPGAAEVAARMAAELDG